MGKGKSKNKPEAIGPDTIVTLKSLPTTRHLVMTAIRVEAERVFKTDRRLSEQSISKKVAIVAATIRKNLTFYLECAESDGLTIRELTRVTIGMLSQEESSDRTDIQQYSGRRGGKRLPE